MATKQVLISTDLVGRPVAESTIEKFKQLNGPNAELLTSFLHTNLSDHDVNDAPSGHASSFGAKTLATDDVVKNNVASQSMLFELKMRDKNGNLCDIENASTFERELLEKKDLLNSELRQKLKEGQNPISLYHNKNPKSLSDKAMWVASLGEQGRIGVYKQETAHDEFKYYLHVYIGQTEASKELYKEVMKMKPLMAQKKNASAEDKKQMTLGEFINGQQYKYTCSVNQRNARRIALKAAKILNVHIESEVDKFAYVPNHHMKKPELAIPVVSNESNILVAGKFRDAPCVYSFDDTVCLKQVTGGLILSQNATMPLSVVFFDANFDAKTLKNGANHSFPVSVGTKKTIDELDFDSLENKKSLFSNKELTRIDERITWEGKSDGTQPYNARLVSSIHNTFDLQNKTQQAVLNQLYASFSKNVKELRPVLLKISSD